MALNKNDKICGGKLLTSSYVHQVLREDNQQTWVKDEKRVTSKS